MHFSNTELCKNSYENNKREQLQLLFDRCFKDGNTTSLRENYKMLRQLELDSDLNFDNEIVDVSSIAEAVSIACDVVIAETGASFIYCGNDTMPVLCNQRFVIKALLNLLSNAYLYGCEKLVTIKTIETNKFVRLEVHSSGAFINNCNGLGLDFVRRICQKAKGRFFIEQSPTETRAVMIFQKARNYESLNDIDFYSLINDRLSPVYIELFGMEYH